MSGEHGPDELYEKFTVIRNRTGETLGQDGEFIFVLRPERDGAARAALRAYAFACRPNGYRQLSDQIRRKLRDLET